MDVNWNMLMLSSEVVFSCEARRKAHQEEMIFSTFQQSSVSLRRPPPPPLSSPLAQLAQLHGPLDGIEEAAPDILLG